MILTYKETDNFFKSQKCPYLCTRYWNINYMNRRFSYQKTRQAGKAPRGRNITIEQETTLLPFLFDLLKEQSRSSVKALLGHGQILVNQEVTTQFDTPLKPGDVVTISYERGKVAFNNQLLNIVYEDDFVIVINKKEGLLSVATAKVRERTAYHILSDYLKKSDPRNKIFVLHRLDRETSGLMMFAKDEKTQRTLRDNWHEIVTDRRYVAVVTGEMEKNAGCVISWLTDRTLYVYSSPTDDGGQKAITHYRTIKRANGYSLVELDLETGRKNQIRVHMQDLGHPIIGDGRYGIEDVNPIGRLALHAFKLCFYHPVTGELMKFETPYPNEFKKLFLKK